MAAMLLHNTVISAEEGFGAQLSRRRAFRRMFRFPKPNDLTAILRRRNSRGGSGSTSNLDIRINGQYCC
jgi:hypothetical protein